MPKHAGSINDGMVRRGGPVEHIVVTIGVQDIEKTLANVVYGIFFIGLGEAKFRLRTNTLCQFHLF